MRLSRPSTWLRASLWKSLRPTGSAVTRCTVPVSPGRAAVPTGVHCVPSAESYPVTVAPSRTSRSQRSADADTVPARPGVSLT